MLLQEVFGQSFEPSSSVDSKLRTPLFVLITVILSLYHSNLECIRMHLVEEFEGPVVNVDLIDGEVVLQTLQEVRHASLGLHALQTLIFISNISICI